MEENIETFLETFREYIIIILDCGCSCIYEKKRKRAIYVQYAKIYKILKIEYSKHSL